MTIYWILILFLFDFNSITVLILLIFSFILPPYVTELYLEKDIHGWTDCKVKQHQSKSKMSGTHEREEERNENNVPFLSFYETREYFSFTCTAVWMRNGTTECMRYEGNANIHISLAVRAFVRSFVPSRLHTAHNAHGRQTTHLFYSKKHRLGSYAFASGFLYVFLFDVPIFGYD